MKSRFFWKDGCEGLVQGGYYFRVFDLVKFFKKLEDNGEKIVGLKFDGNNVNVLVKGDGKTE